MAKAAKPTRAKKPPRKYQAKNIKVVDEGVTSTTLAVAPKEEKQVVADAPQQSPKERNKKFEEPSLIRFSRNVGGYGGAILGGMVGSRFGFGGKIASLGSEYGTKLAEYGARKLIESVPVLGSFKKGGRVKKTGAYILHKGETVVPVRKKR
jgi:hypothetical protein